MQEEQKKIQALEHFVQKVEHYSGPSPLLSHFYTLTKFYSQEHDYS